ncbi:hypothetical protein RJ640_012658 [Escallonia rubra]|uniref:Uncharacterized protein n=1 Tax=Escallonia rubra TaxID=112253 RepID=A0AA88UEE2_9ASTE|nr:hypothetical protein RJ640_012658 [Escallonia rubra]
MAVHSPTLMSRQTSHRWVKHTRISSSQAACDSLSSLSLAPLFTSSVTATIVVPSSSQHVPFMAAIPLGDDSILRMGRCAHRGGEHPSKLDQRKFGGKMELIKLSKFKLQLRALISEIRELRDKERSASDQLHLFVQGQKQAEEEFNRKLTELQSKLTLSNELRQKLEMKVNYLQNDNALIENKQKELKETINSLLQSRERFVKAYEDSTCEMKRSIESRDRQIAVLNEKINAHLLLVDSIAKEAFFVKQIVDNAQHVLCEKEEVGMIEDVDQNCRVKCPHEAFGRAVAEIADAASPMCNPSRNNNHFDSAVSGSACSSPRSACSEPQVETGVETKGNCTTSVYQLDSECSTTQVENP